MGALRVSGNGLTCDMSRSNAVCSASESSCSTAQYVYQKVCSMRRHASRDRRSVSNCGDAGRSLLGRWRNACRRRMSGLMAYGGASSREKGRRMTLKWSVVDTLRCNGVAMRTIIVGQSPLQVSAFT